MTKVDGSGITERSGTMASSTIPLIGSYPFGLLLVSVTVEYALFPAKKY